MIEHGSTLSFGRMINRLTLRAVTIALLTFTTCLLIYQAWLFKQNLIERLDVTAVVLGANVTAALEFEDREQADMVLGALRSEPDVVRATLYDKSWRVLTVYQKGLSLPEQSSADVNADAVARRLARWVSGGVLEKANPIELRGETIGYLQLTASTERFLAQWLTGMLLIIGVALLAGWVSLLNTSFIRKSVSIPIADLAQSMRNVMTQGNFGLRVDSAPIQEMEQLSDSFNALLDHVEQRDQTVAQQNRLLLQSNQDLTLALDEATRAKRQAEQAALIKARFLANMSHEIRTPLSGVLGMAELLMDTQLNKDQSQLVQTLHETGKSLLDIINDILDFSKIEAGKLSLNHINFQLSDLLGGLHALFSPSAVNKGLYLRIQIKGEIPDNYIGDPVRLRQILSNLIGNAIKFTESGGIQILIGYHPGDNRECKLTFEVIDTGIGIPSTQQQQIFEAFAQADTGFDRRYGGTGLGLSIASQLAHLMNGRIELQSKVGQGSTFSATVSLHYVRGPRVLGSSQALSEHVPRPRIVETPLSDMGFTHAHHVLVVEDHPINSTLVKAILERMGLRVTVVDSGLQAIHFLTDNPDVELVLMDCQMPEMDGFEATRLIRLWEQTRTQNRLPVIALTANAMEGDRERCHAAGMDDYMTKPFTARGLFDKLRYWLKTHSHNLSTND